MNKIIKFFVLLVLVFFAFVLGFKMGDARGFSQGYDVGYSYDCRDEINQAVRRSDSVSRALDFLSRECQASAIENHRNRYERHSDSVFNATGSRLPSFDSAVKRSQQSVRETMRRARELGTVR